MPRTKADNKAIREKTKMQIIEGARKAFIKNGLSVTIAEIATESNISQGLVYRYFRSKDELYTAILEESLRSKDTIKIIVENIKGTSVERLRTIILGLIKHRFENPEFYQFFYYAFRNQKLPKQIHEKILEQGKALTETLRLLIIEGQQAGEISMDDPDIFIQIITSFLNEISIVSTSKNTMDYVSTTDILLRILQPNQNRREN